MKTVTAASQLCDPLKKDLHVISESGDLFQFVNETAFFSPGLKHEAIISHPLRVVVENSSISPLELTASSKANDCGSHISMVRISKKFNALVTCLTSH